MVMNPADEPTQQFFEKYETDFQAGKFPAPTDSNEGPIKHRFHLSINGNKPDSYIDLTIIDAAGKFINPSEGHKAYLDVMAVCDASILMIDAENENDRAHRSLDKLFRAIECSPATAEKVFFVTSLSKIDIQSIWLDYMFDATGPGSHFVHNYVVKKVFAKNAFVRDRINAYADCSQMEFVGLSSVGRYKDPSGVETSNVVRIEGGAAIVDLENWEPHNLFEPLNIILKKKGLPGF